MGENTIFFVATSRHNNSQVCSRDNWWSLPRVESEMAWRSCLGIGEWTESWENLSEGHVVR